MLYDILGAALSLISTYFFIVQNQKAWPTGMVATALNAWLYFQSGIYADTGLELFYFASSLYGWRLWSKGIKSSAEPEVRFASLSLHVLLFVIFILLYGIIAYGLNTYSNSSVIRLDAFTTALSLIAQWMMCQKIISTWVLWFITDALYAGLYLQKGLPFHAGLMLLYTGMAVAGFWAWWRGKDRGRTLRVRPWESTGGL